LVAGQNAEIKGGAVKDRSADVRRFDLTQQHELVGAHRVGQRMGEVDDRDAFNRGRLLTRSAVAGRRDLDRRPPAVRGLDALIARHGRTAMIASDVGTEMTSMAFLGLA
jgi:hypothetical protein